MQIVTGTVVVILLLVLVRAALTRGEETFSRTAAGGNATAPSEEAIRDFLLHGRKIQAIKAYRTLHRVDLKTAKEAIDRLAEQLPPTA